MQSLDFVSLAHILPRLLSNTCPSTVPRSGSAGAQINCFVTTVRDVNDPELLLLRMVGDQIEAAQFDGDRYSVDVIVPLSAIDPNKVHLTHFYGTDEVRYQGVWAVARGLLDGLAVRLDSLTPTRTRNSPAALQSPDSYCTASTPGSA